MGVLVEGDSRLPPVHIVARIARDASEKRDEARTKRQERAENTTYLLGVARGSQCTPKVASTYFWRVFRSLATKWPAMRSTLSCTLLTP